MTWHSLIPEGWPKDTENRKYYQIPNGLQIDALLELAQDLFPGEELSNILIHIERIHVDHLTYDLHDESDWANFLVIERKVHEDSKG